MKKNTKNLIFAIALVLVGFVGPLIVRYFSLNIFSLILILFLNVCKFGGLILLVVSLIKIFSKKRIDLELLEEQKIIKEKKLLISLVIFYVLGLLSSFSPFIIPRLCDADTACSIVFGVVGIFIFIPFGIVFVIIGSLKLRKFLKIKNA